MVAVGMGSLLDSRVEAKYVMPVILGEYQYCLRRPDAGLDITEIRT